MDFQPARLDQTKKLNFSVAMRPQTCPSSWVCEVSPWSRGQVVKSFPVRVSSESRADQLHLAPAPTETKVPDGYRRGRLEITEITGELYF